MMCSTLREFLARNKSKSLSVFFLMATLLTTSSLPMPVFADGGTSLAPLGIDTTYLSATNVHLNLSNPSAPELLFSDGVFNGITISSQTTMGTGVLESTGAVLDGTDVVIGVTSEAVLTNMLASYVDKDSLTLLQKGGTLPHVDFSNVHWRMLEGFTAMQFSVRHFTLGLN